VIARTSRRDVFFCWPFLGTLLVTSTSRRRGSFFRMACFRGRAWEASPPVAAVGFSLDLFFFRIFPPPLPCLMRDRDVLSSKCFSSESTVWPT